LGNVNKGKKYNHRDHILVASAHEKKTLIARDSRSKLLKRFILLKNLLDLTWQLMESSNDLGPSFGERDAVFRQLEGHHQESNVL